MAGNFFFWGCALFGIKSINQSAKLNWILITFQVEIVSLMPCVFVSFTTLRLSENDVSFAWMILLEMHFLLILSNQPNLLKNASIDHNSFPCCFFPIFGKVWRHRYEKLYEIKVFFLLYATNTSVFKWVNMLLAVVLQQRSQKLFS